jgi:hypothetical protein
MENTEIDAALLELLGGATSSSSSSTTSFVPGVAISTSKTLDSSGWSSTTVSSSSLLPSLEKGNLNLNTSGERSRLKDFSKRETLFSPPSPSSSFSSELSLLPSQLSKPLPRLAPEELAKLAPLASVSLHSKKRPRHSSPTGIAKVKSTSRPRVSSPPPSPFARFGPFLTSSSPLAREAATSRLVIGISPQGGLRTVTSVPLPHPPLSSALSNETTITSSILTSTSLSAAPAPMLSSSSAISSTLHQSKRDRTSSQASNSNRSHQHNQNIVIEDPVSSEAVVLLQQLEAQSQQHIKGDEEKKQKRRHRKRALSLTATSGVQQVDVKVQEAQLSVDTSLLAESVQLETELINKLMQESLMSNNNINDDEEKEEAEEEEEEEGEDEVEREEEEEEDVDDLVAIGLAFLEQDGEEEIEMKEVEVEEVKKDMEEKEEEEEDISNYIDDEESSRLARKAARKEQRRLERRELKRILREHEAQEAKKGGDTTELEESVTQDAIVPEEIPLISEKPGRKERRRLKRLAKEEAAKKSNS